MSVKRLISWYTKIVIWSNEYNLMPRWCAKYITSSGAQPDIFLTYSNILSGIWSSPHGSETEEEWRKDGRKEELHLR